MTMHINTSITLLWCRLTGAALVLVKVLVLGAVIACSAAGQSTAPESVAQERLRIDAQRKQADANFETEQRQCQTKFAAASCTHDAAMRRIEAMAALKRHEVSLNNAERAEEAVARQRSIEEKRAEREANAAPARDAAQRALADKQQAQQDKLQQHASQTDDPQDRPVAQKIAAPVDANLLEKNRAAHASKLQAAEKRRLQRDKRLGETRPLPTSFLPVPP